MLSFEISVIDVVLVLAIIVLLILYITKLSTKSVAEPELSVPEEKGAEKTSKAVETQKSIDERRLPTRPQTSSLECPYHFGYLKKLPEHAPIPDECFRCPRMAECFCK
jgi:Na+-transporting methylmalonyl-CoA/oxaloacetate decarboxylase gamma subunit